MSPATTWTGRPVWVSRDGREESARITEDAIAPQYPRLSPDGRRVALIVAGDVWVYDLSGTLPIRLTSGARYSSPIWSADGRRLVMEGTTLPQRLWVIAADGSEQQPQPASAVGHFHPLTWSDDGRGVLAVEFVGGPSNIDIVRWQPGKPEEREPVGTDLGAGRTQRGVALARWPVARAYVRSDRSGRSVGPAVPGSWCAGPGVNQRRYRACLVQNRPRAVLPGRATGHGGRRAVLARRSGSSCRRGSSTAATGSSVNPGRTMSRPTAGF